jgi:hypothetical protein
VFGDGQAAVRMASNKPYRDMPPIYFAGPKEEVQALLEKLLEEVKS